MTAVKTLAFACVLLAPLGFFAAAAAGTTETLTVDARAVAQRVLHARLELPVDGPVTLVYPKWLPGTHAPEGQVIDVAGLEATADGRRVEWKRDYVGLDAFTFDVPRGATRTLTVRYDVMLPQRIATSQLALLDWYWTAFYPRGATNRDTIVRAAMLVPAGWDAASALPGPSRTGATFTWEPATLERLIDSPVLIGSRMTRVAAGPDAELDVAGDGRTTPVVGDDVRAAFAKTVAEAETIFGGHHWDAPYHFLITASDAIGFNGLEHHNSSYNGVDTDSLASLKNAKSFAGDLLTHEFTHSWDGKYRRPADQDTRDYEGPWSDELLWVYEGMTEYYGVVLAARAGFWTPADALQHFANDYANLDSDPGRATRPLVDAQRDEVIDPRRSRNAAFTANRFEGGVQYSEGTMIWLDADTLIRDLSRGAKSLDTFAAQFFGGVTGPVVAPYTRADLIAALNAVQPYDWATFFHDRVDVATPHPPGAWIARGGYTLAYVAKPVTPPPNQRTPGGPTWRYGPGFTVTAQGRIADVVAGTAAARAGLAPGQQIVAVDGRRWANDDFTDVIERAAKTKAATALLIDDRGTYVTRTLVYADGIRLPELQRTTGPARLDDILKPRT